MVKAFLKNGLTFEILHRSSIGQLGHRWGINATHMGAASAAVEKAGKTACCLVNYRLGVLSHPEALSILVVEQVHGVDFQLWRTEIPWLLKIVGFE